MNSSKTNIVLAVASVIVLGAVACFLFSSSYKANMEILPDNPLVLAKIEAGKLLKESEVLENKYIKEKFDDALDNLDDMPSDVQDKIREIFNDPGESGIDLSSPVVFALYGEEEFVFSVPVSSKSKLVDMLTVFLETNDYELNETDDIYYICDDDGERVKNMAFNSDVMIISYKRPAKYYFNHDGKKAVDNDKYDDFFDSDDELAVFVDGESFVSEFKKYIMHEGIPSQIIEVMEGASIFAGASLKGNTAVTSMKINLADDYEPFLECIENGTGKHFEYMPKNSLAIANVRLNINEDVRKVLRQIPEYYDAMADALSTEYTVALLPSAACGKYLEEYPRFVAAADCSNDAFKLILELLKKQTGFKENSDGTYSLGLNRDHLWGIDVEYSYTSGYDYVMKYADGVLLVLPEDIYRSEYADGKLKNNAGQNDLYDDNRGVALIVDDVRVMAWAEAASGQKIGDYKSKFFGHTFLEINTLGDIVLRHELIDPNVNPLKAAVDAAVDEMVNMEAQRMKYMRDYGYEDNF